MLRTQLHHYNIIRTTVSSHEPIEVKVAPVRTFDTFELVMGRYQFFLKIPILSKYHDFRYLLILNLFYLDGYLAT